MNNVDGMEKNRKTPRKSQKVQTLSTTGTTSPARGFEFGISAMVRQRASHWAAEIALSCSGKASFVNYRVSSMR